MINWFDGKKTKYQLIEGNVAKKNEMNKLHGEGNLGER